MLEGQRKLVETVVSLLEIERQKVESIQELAQSERRKDSIEIGTPSKGGAMKVYFDATDKDEAAQLVQTAGEILALGQVIHEKYAPQRRNGDV